MRTVELFSGSGVVSERLRERGHDTYTVDINPNLNPDMVYDLTRYPNGYILRKKMYEADFIWMSPPCTTFSMASGYTHWDRDRNPRTVQAVEGKMMVDVCRTVMDMCETFGKYYCVENPMGRMRWFMPKERLTHVWFCRYGMSYAKPTDIWNNIPDWDGKKCKRGNLDHESAPRGSRYGLQGVKGAYERGKIPIPLIDEIIDKVEYWIEVNRDTGVFHQ